MSAGIAFLFTSASRKRLGAFAIASVVAASCTNQAAPPVEASNSPKSSSTSTSVAHSRTLITVESSEAVQETTSSLKPVTPTTAEPQVETTTSTSTTTQPLAPAGWVQLENNRYLPVVPEAASDFALLLETLEREIREPDTTTIDHRDLGHGEQILVRALMRRDDRDAVVGLIDEDVRWIVEAHVRARSELGSLHTAAPIEQIPKWNIIEPAPQADLISFYQSASAATGIKWEVLAAINLIETGLGRIQGLSTAGARGPMQFLPTTWVEVSQGGDIDDPEDAIHGAARYLVRRGGLEDIRKGLWGYNNSDHYVNAVLEYAAMIEADPAVFDALYGWEIYVGSASGTLWLPSGNSFDSPTAAADYLSAHPWVKTLG